MQGSEVVTAADTCAAIRWVLSSCPSEPTDVIEALLDRREALDSPSTVPSQRVGGDAMAALMDAVEHGRLKLDVEAPF